MLDVSNTDQITLLDGGMGRELMRVGAPFRQPEWSALSLMEAPELVKKVHESFAKVGSDILTTSNYAVIPFHIGEKRFAEEGAKLTELSGRLAREVASSYGIKVAGSIPPLFGSYRPDLFTPEKAADIQKTIVNALRPNVDLWLVETTSSIEESNVVMQGLWGEKLPVWMSFTLMDSEQEKNDIPRLRSGDTVENAVRSVVEKGVSAILFNCSQPEVMAPAISVTISEMQRLGVNIPVGVYANAFPAIAKNAEANSSLCDIRPDLDPKGYLSLVDSWCRLGATIVGGCCGIGPEHIEKMYKRLK